MTRGTSWTASGITKSFGATPVLRGVALTLGPGEVHALLGENGAGKSTLMRVVLGLEQPDAGTMMLNGVPYRPRSAADARSRGVVMVPQERTLCPHLTVLENIVLGVEPTRLGVLQKVAARAKAERALAMVLGRAAARRITLSARAGELSVADQQLVEIGRALAQAGVDSRGRSKARLFVLDEPTSSLGRDDTSCLFDCVRALKELGLAVLLVTHFLADVRAHADRYTVLRDGVVQGEGDPRATPTERIIEEMLGSELASTLAASSEAHGITHGSTRMRAAASPSRPKFRAMPPAPPMAARSATPHENARLLLEVRAISGVQKPLRASFELRCGEILGIAGLVGSGRTELLRIVLGLDAARGGEIVRHAPCRIGLLSEDRAGEGLMLGRSIGENVTLSARSPFWVRPSTTFAEGQRWIERLGIRARDAAQHAVELSGGNQQKLQVARLLREDYDVLLVDEPTRGIDVASKAQVLSLLRDLAVKGKGVILVSSQLDELLATCDRLAVMRGGTLGEARPPSTWTEASLLLESAS